MSYSVFRTTKRWTPLNTVRTPAPPQPMKRTDKQNGGKPSRSLKLERRKFHQLMKEMCAHEPDVVLRVDNDKEAQRLAEKKAGGKEEVAKVDLKEEASDDATDDEDECHYGLLMCMSF